MVVVINYCHWGRLDGTVLTVMIWLASVGGMICKKNFNLQYLVKLNFVLNLYGSLHARDILDGSTPIGTNYRRITVRACGESESCRIK